MFNLGIQLKKTERDHAAQAELFWFSGTLSFDVFELVSKKSKDLRLFFL
jgi:hypothetical protein